MANRRYHILFSDIGGVLGTNGWDTRLRRKIAARYSLNVEELERRHHLMFDSFERGYMSFEDYLGHVFFEQQRSFTVDEIRDFAFSESVAWPDCIDLLRRVKTLNGLKLALISNEGEGLTNYRVRAWGLRELADFLIFSYCVHMRKPDRAMWQLGLDVAQARPEESIYIDDRPMFVEIAGNLGFTAIQHVSVESTRDQLARLGLAVD
ncbi:MAG TPA: HAD-IA family hydrolase [Bryobacteraceae bacterium]|jgi:putative hydrolase of the HAD superfamily|nr:HAD-IA family hydrolase [Bryobacteraceae bacterium]